MKEAGLNEADMRAELIDPALRDACWLKERQTAAPSTR